MNTLGRHLAIVSSLKGNLEVSIGSWSNYWKSSLFLGDSRAIKHTETRRTCVDKCQIFGRQTWATLASVNSSLFRNSAWTKIGTVSSQSRWVTIESTRAQQPSLKFIRPLYATSFPGIFPSKLGGAAPLPTSKGKTLGTRLPYTERQLLV